MKKMYLAVIVGIIWYALINHAQDYYGWGLFVTFLIVFFGA